MSECGICKSKTNRYDDLLHCIDVDCKRFYHIACVHVSVEKFTEMKSDGTAKNWKCPTCSMDSQDEMESRIKNFIKLMLNEIKTEIKDVKSSQCHISLQYDDIIKRLDEVVSLKKRVMDLETKLVEKNEKIENLQHRLVQVEQYGRRRQLEIRNIKVIDGENTKKVVCTLVSKMGINLNHDDIDACHRIPNYKGQFNTIIVELNSRKKREEIITKKRAQLNIKSKDIVGVGEEPVYINESLSPHFKNLLWQAKQKLKTYDYKFVWFKKNLIFAKKDKDSKIVHKIITVADLENIKN